MRARWPVLIGFVALGAGYVGYPYATLYRLDSAMRGADAATVRSLVDWYAVREGLKEDIGDMARDGPENARPRKELAPFGAGFMRGITRNVLDQSITPEAIVSATYDRRENAHVVWAFFNTPTQFLVRVRTDVSAEPISVMLELHNLCWRVRRVWLPNTLLERVGS